MYDDGTAGWLAEDNGAYVFTRPIDPGRELPEAARFRIGTTTAINGKSPEVIAALADFYDSLNPAQQQKVREFMDKRGRWYNRG